MRRKLFLLTMGLASSVWSAGCQHRATLPCADTHSSQDLTCCSAHEGSSVATTRSIPLRSMARRTPISRPSAEPLVIYSDEPIVTQEGATEGLHWVETDSQPTVVGPRARSQQFGPEGAVPIEAPLPPPAFPDVLPGPARGSLQPSQFEETIIIRDVPADQMPVMQSPSGVTDATPVVLPNGDQLIELGSKTISFGAGENYRTLTGEVQQFRRGWRLRYAAVDAEDAHGGSVSLVGQGLERLRDGVHIRVTGTLIPAEDRLSSPRFQVQALEMLEP